MSKRTNTGISVSIATPVAMESEAVFIFTGFGFIMASSHNKEMDEMGLSLGGKKNKNIFLSLDWSKERPAASIQYSQHFCKPSRKANGNN